MRSCCLFAAQLLVASDLQVGENLESVTSTYQSAALMLDRGFFQRDPVTCARELVGCKLTCGTLSGIVVETEAYDAEGDDACHTAFRPSARAFVSGHAAGRRLCLFQLRSALDAECSGQVRANGIRAHPGARAARRHSRDEEGAGSAGREAIVFRAGEANEGPRDNCPSSWQGHVFRREFRVFARGATIAVVNSSLRIGISRAMDLPWRFYAAGNPHVSRTSPKQGRAGVEPARLQK